VPPIGRGERTRFFSYALFAAVSLFAEDELQAGLARLAPLNWCSSVGRPPDSAMAFKHALGEGRGLAPAAHLSPAIAARSPTTLSNPSPSLWTARPSSLPALCRSRARRKHPSFGGAGPAVPTRPLGRWRIGWHMQTGTWTTGAAADSPTPWTELEFLSPWCGAHRRPKLQCRGNRHAYARARKLGNRLGSPFGVRLQFPYVSALYQRSPRCPRCGPNAGSKDVLRLKPQTQ